MIQLSEQQIIDQLTIKLADAHKQVGLAHVSKVVKEKYNRFDGSPIRDFVPLLVERHAKAELAQLGS
jgi:hypothetical protein